MSSILKALKKLEEERNVRPGVNPDIGKSILRGGRKGAGRAPWLFPAAGMSGAAFVAVLVTYIAMGGFSRKQEQAAVPPTPVRKEERPAPQAPVAASSPSPVYPSAPSRRESPHAGIEARPAVPGIRNSPPAATPLPLPAAPVRPPTVEQTPAAQPALRVNGIAWQQDGSSRVAIVNGQSVAEGGMVAGARVEEIARDRVRFTFGGRGFDVPLEK